MDTNITRAMLDSWQTQKDVPNILVRDWKLFGPFFKELVRMMAFVLVFAGVPILMITAIFTNDIVLKGIIALGFGIGWLLFFEGWGPRIN